MFDILKTRLKQKHRTMSWPAGPAPELPDRYAGLPLINGFCLENCTACFEVCPTGAIFLHGDAALSRHPSIDLGRCLFCRKCERICPESIITFSKDHRLSAVIREHLMIKNHAGMLPEIKIKNKHKMFCNSLKLRQVSAGGCNACEADTNVLGTIGWDLSRFGIDFVASPRHADGLLITGPVTCNMKKALIKTYEAIPHPKIVIATGTCAISGGPYAGHPEQNNGVDALFPIDLFIPGCPPHPLTIIQALLSFLGKI